MEHLLQEETSVFSQNNKADQHASLKLVSHWDATNSRLVGDKGLPYKRVNDLNYVAVYRICIIYLSHGADRGNQEVFTDGDSALPHQTYRPRHRNTF